MKGFGRRLSRPNPGNLPVFVMGLRKTMKKLSQDNRRLGRDSKWAPGHVTTTTACPGFYISCWCMIMVNCVAFVMQRRMTSTVTVGPFHMCDFLLMLISVKFVLTWRSRCQWLQHNLHFTPKVLFSYAYKINYGQMKNSVPNQRRLSSLQKPLGRSEYRFLLTQLLVT